MQARIRQFDVRLTPTLAKISSYPEPHGQVCSQVDENSVRCLKHLSSEFYSFHEPLKRFRFTYISYEKSESRNYSIRDNLKFCIAPNKIDGTENNYVEDKNFSQNKICATVRY
jgi:hypothetical protein